MKIDTGDSGRLYEHCLMGEKWQTTGLGFDVCFGILVRVGFVCGGAWGSRSRCIGKRHAVKWEGEVFVGWRASLWRADVVT